MCVRGETAIETKGSLQKLCLEGSPVMGDLRIGTGRTSSATKGEWPGPGLGRSCQNCSTRCFIVGARSSNLWNLWSLCIASNGDRIASGATAAWGKEHRSGTSYGKGGGSLGTADARQQAFFFSHLGLPQGARVMAYTR